MKRWYRQWDDFLNEAEEPKLKSSGNVDSHFEKTVADMTAGQKTEVSDALEDLFSDQDFSSLFTKYQADPDSLELEDKDFLADAAEQFIRERGLTDAIDLPGPDAAIEFVHTLKKKVKAMEEEAGDYSLHSDPMPGPFHVGQTGLNRDEAIVGAAVGAPYSD